MPRRHHAVPGPPPSYRVLGWVAEAFTTLLRQPVRTTGLDHVPRDSGAVIAWHHVSHLDFLIGGLDLYRRRGRSYHPLALRELWDMSGPPGWGVKLGHAIPVDRDDPTDRVDAIRDAVTAARNGRLVMVAPAGRIQPVDDLGAYRTGAVRIAQRAGVPMVPHVALGTEQLVDRDGDLHWRRAWRLPHEVAFGRPMTVAPDEDPRVATQRLRERMAELVAETRARRG